MKYIDADALSESVNALLRRADANEKAACLFTMSILANASAVDVAPVIRAKWYVAEWNSVDANRVDSFYCDNCHCVEPSTMRFCPNCGAEMENGKDYRPRTLKDIASNYPPDGPVNCGARRHCLGIGGA